MKHEGCEKKGSDQQVTKVLIVLQIHLMIIISS